MKPHGIDCSEVLERLPLLPGGDLEPHLAEMVTAHLEGCVSCAAESVRLHSALAALAALRDDTRDDTRDDSLDGQQTGPDAGIDVWAPVRAALSAEGRFAAAPVAAVGPLGREPARTGALSEARSAPAPRPWRRVAAWSAAAAAVVVCWNLWPSAPQRAALPQGGVAHQVQPALDAAALAAQSGVALPEDAPLAPAGGLRRAAGEERRRDFSVPFDAPGDRNGAWSLAGDRELR